MSTSIKDILGVISVLVGAVSYGLYIRSILSQKTRPHLFTWIIWGLGVAIILVAQISKGAGAGAWTTALSFFACVAIVFLAWRHGAASITRSDWWMLAGALIAILLWVVTREPLGSVIIVILIDSAGFYPTFRKSWHRPDEELLAMYNLDILKYAVGLAAMEQYSLTAMLYPLFVVLSNGGFVAMCLWRRRANN